MIYCLTVGSWFHRKIELILYSSYLLWYTYLQRINQTFHFEGGKPVDVGCQIAFMCFAENSFLSNHLLMDEKLKCLHEHGGIYKQLQSQRPFGEELFTSTE